MPTSSITSIEVSYHPNDKINLKAIVVFSVPLNSNLQNPDGSISATFRARSNGTGATANDVTLDFELVSSGAIGYTSITRTAIITLNHSFSAAHKTTAILKSSGTTVSSKDETSANYTEDPDR